MYKNLAEMTDKEVEDLLTVNYKSLRVKLAQTLKDVTKLKNFQMRIAFKNEQISGIAIDDADTEENTITAKFDHLSERYDVLNEAVADLDHDETELSQDDIQNLEEIEEFIGQIGFALKNIKKRIDSIEKIRKIEPEKKKEEVEIED